MGTSLQFSSQLKKVSLNNMISWGTPIKIKDSTEEYVKTYIYEYPILVSHNIEDKESEMSYGLKLTDESCSNDQQLEMQSRIYKNMQRKIIESKKPILFGLLKESDYEMGFESKAEKYFNELYEKYEATADTILQNIYLENMDGNAHIIKEILFIIAELPKERRKNIAYIAIAGLDNPDDEIKDLSIRCFEVWNEKTYLSILNNHPFSDKWLETYRQDVIKELELNGE